MSASISKGRWFRYARRSSRVPRSVVSPTSNGPVFRDGRASPSTIVLFRPAGPRKAWAGHGPWGGLANLQGLFPCTCRPISARFPRSLPTPRPPRSLDALRNWRSLEAGGIPWHRRTGSILPSPAPPSAHRRLRAPVPYKVLLASPHRPGLALNYAHGSPRRSQKSKSIRTVSSQL
jgi:hypothetical protein